MRFADVVGIKLPEGDVVKIACGGMALWEAPSGDGPPAGYVPCEYIQFSAKQYVITDIIPNTNTKLEIVFTRESSSAQYLYGVRNSNNTASVTAYLSSSGAWRFGNTYRNFTPALNVKHTVTVDKTGINFDGTNYAYVATVKAFTANAALQIGSTRGTSGGLGSPQFTGKIYLLKIWESDELLADYMPCKNPEGVYGFWDNVARKFQPSGTENPFTGG